MYGSVLVADCTIHFINVLNTERAKRARKKYVASYKLPDRFAFNILSPALFLIAKDTIIMLCHIKKQDDVHPQKIII